MTSLVSQLMAHLDTRLDALRIRREQLGVDIEGGRIEPGGAGPTEQGIHAADYHYTAVLAVERLPAGSVQLLMLLVILWLAAHDPARHRYALPWPAVDIMDVGNGLCDLVMEIAFVDPFYIGADPDGPLVIDGVAYSVDAWQLDIAESGNVEGASL